MSNYNEWSDAFRRLAFSFSLIGLKRFEAGCSVSEFIHPYYTIHYMVRGRARYIMNRIPYTAGPGTIAVFKPGTAFQWETETEFEHYHLRFDCREIYKLKSQWVGEIGQEPDFPLFGVYPLKQPERIHRLFEGLYQLYPKADSVSELAKQTGLQQLWLEIAEDYRLQSASGDAGYSIRSTIDYIHRHFNEELTVRGLAGMAGLHPSHYCRRFKQLTGISPKAYMTMCRMNEAKRLLVCSDMSLRGIAGRVGYADELYFSRLFKAVTGVPPSEYTGGKLRT